MKIVGMAWPCYSPTTRTFSMTPSDSGTSLKPNFAPVGTPLIWSTTCMPSAARPNTQYPQPDGVAPVWFRKSLSATLMKNWLPAECGSPVRAMAIVPRVLRRPLLASFSIGGGGGVCVGLVLDRRACRLLLHAGAETAALDHELVNHPVKQRSVIEPVLHVLQEVGHGPGRLLLVELHA